MIIGIMEPLTLLTLAFLVSILILMWNYMTDLVQYLKNYLVKIYNYKWRKKMKRTIKFIVLLVTLAVIQFVIIYSIHSRFPALVPSIIMFLSFIF